MLRSSCKRTVGESGVLSMTVAHLIMPFAVALGSAMSARLPVPVSDEIIPDSLNGWHVQGQVATYDRKTVFDYLDGGAEIYLAYGMTSVRAVRYAGLNEPSIDVSIFEMAEPEGAFGAFTYERLDPEAGIGQGSEYGAGMLRFWHGRFFVFIQAERETPASREATIALGKVLASRLGAEAKVPALPDALPQQGLRPLTVRYVLSPLILKNLERTLSDNPLGLPQHAATVIGRYWKAGNPERILLVRFADESAARKGVDSYRKARKVGVHPPAEPFKGPEGWSIVEASGNHAVLILDAPDATSAREQFNEISLKLKEISP